MKVALAVITCGLTFIAHRIQSSGIPAGNAGKYTNPDPCDTLCTTFPGTCGPSFSYCRNNLACHDMFWTDKKTEDGTPPFCYAGKVGCNLNLSVLCVEAAKWLLKSSRRPLSAHGGLPSEILRERLEAMVDDSVSEGVASAGINRKPNYAEFHLEGVSEEDQLAIALIKSELETNVGDISTLPVPEIIVTDDAGVAPATQLSDSLSETGPLKTVSRRPLIQGPRAKVYDVSGLSEDEQAELAKNNSLTDSEQTGQDYDIDPNPGRRGIANLGNTCYMNALLQVLGHTPVFVELLKNLDFTLVIDEGSSLLRELKNVVVDQMWGMYDNNGEIDMIQDIADFEPIVPTKLFTCLSKEYAAKTQVTDLQEDSMHAMQLILNALDKHFVNAKIVQDMFGVPYTSVKKCAECSKERAQVEPTELIWKLPIPSLQDEPLLENSIDNPISLFDCFALFAKEYTREDWYNDTPCDECANVEFKYKWVVSSDEIIKGPTMLVVQFAKPLQENVQPFVSYATRFKLEDVPGTRNLQGNYELTGVIFLSGHHYTCMFWDPLFKEWVNANDNSVTSIDKLIDVSNTVYALVYEQRDL